MAGAKVLQAGQRPRHVTTALFGLDSSRVLGTAHDAADSWDQVADLIHRHVTSLKDACDQDRASRGLPPLRMLGVGVESGAPVYNGQVMPLSRDRSSHPVPLADKLHRLFEADPGFDRPVPVISENDVNALAMLTIHQIHYAVPDLVVVGVDDGGVGGGLVMDGGLGRGGNGGAMEVGHISVGFPLGQDPYSSATGTRFKARCLCGQLGHVNTLAPPRRIVEDFGGGTLEQISQINTRDPEFQRAQQVFKQGGAALGRALAHVSNTVNPSRILMYLPAALADPEPDTAATAYLGAVRQEAQLRVRGKRPARLPENPRLPRQPAGFRAVGGAGRRRVRPRKLHRARATSRRLQDRTETQHHKQSRSRRVVTTGRGRARRRRSRRQTVTGPRAIRENGPIIADKP